MREAVNIDEIQFGFMSGKETMDAISLDKYRKVSHKEERFVFHYC